MGCPCREIRAALARVPGGKFLVGLLPALPPKGPAMKMLARVPGQSFNLANGAQYFADADRVLYVAVEDVAEMRRVGCVEAPAEQEPVKAEAPHDPVAQEIMRDEPRLVHLTPAPGSLEEFAASLPDGPEPPAEMEHTEASE